MDTLFGKNDGIEWKVQVNLTTSGVYYALVKVGGIVKITPDFDTTEECQAAGCTLMADTLAELVDVQNAA